MMEGLRSAAIDIGSNAVRLLLSRVFDTESGPYFKKISLIRKPIRLGEDVFTHPTITPEKAEQLTLTLMGFQNLMTAYKPVAYRACATAAMREARNAADIRDRIYTRCGIGIEVIDGQEEGGIIFSNRHTTVPEGCDARLYVDVGGGSTEITLCARDKRVARSFNIGTIRLLQDMVASSEWERMKAWVQQQTCGYRSIAATGSGANIQKLLNLAKRKEGLRISVEQLKRIRNELEAYTVTERVMRLGLKPDRADVILPAQRIYLSVLNWGKSLPSKFRKWAWRTASSACCTKRT